MAIHNVEPAGARRRAAGALGSSVAAALAAEYVPSLVALGQFGPVSALPGELCRWQGPRSERRVALTFDDGPDPDCTPRVLDALDEFELRATFFVLGERVRAYPDVVEEIALRGHELATHGDQHAHHLFRPPPWVRRDLERARDTMASRGTAVHWYRPAFGQATGATLAVARGMGLRTVLWSAWGREWASSSAREVASRINRRLRPGAIVLLHDSERFGPPGMARKALEALPLVADELQRQRLVPVTMHELVG